MLLRLRDERTSNKVTIVLKIVEDYRDRLKGNIIVATEKTVRIRPL